MDYVTILNRNKPDKSCTHQLNKNLNHLLIYCREARFHLPAKLFRVCIYSAVPKQKGCFAATFFHSTFHLLIRSLLAPLRAKTFFYFTFKFCILVIRKNCFQFCIPVVSQFLKLRPVRALA